MANRTPLDQEKNNILTASDQPISPEYRELEEKFHGFTKKERLIQISGTFLSFSAACFEFIVYFMINKIAERNISVATLIRFSWIFSLILVIFVGGLYQLSVVRRWNKNIEDKIRLEHNNTPTTAKPKLLSQINYDLLDQMRKLKTIAILLLILCGLFVYFYFESRITNPPERFQAI